MEGGTNPSRRHNDVVAGSSIGPEHHRLINQTPSYTADVQLAAMETSNTLHCAEEKKH